jgi:hypothetical protein
MLEAGGMPVLTDNIRKPDADNPKGYYEFEQVKKITKDTAWVAECRGKAVKMVSMLLYHLPKEMNYKVIFMRRKMEEVLASQRIMLGRQGKKIESKRDAKMYELFEKHLKEIDTWMAKQQNIDVLYIDYNEAIRDPVGNAEKVKGFLGEELDVDKMAGVIDLTLYRQKK